MSIRKLARGFVYLVAAFAAANVFAAGTLPAGYTEVEYIQGDGSSTRILTDYTPNHLTDKIEAVVSWTAVDKLATIWCSRGATSSTDSWTVFMVNNSGYKFRLDYGTGKDGYASQLTVVANTKYTVTAEDKRIDVVGGAQPASYSYPQSSSFTAGGPIMLFASYWNGTGNNLDNYGKNKLYSFKVWRSGTLIHYFVPCKDANNAATLVDICDNPATLTKSGTFTAGQEGHYYDDSLLGDLTILPIPDQVNETFEPCRPEFVISNMTSGATWTIGGDIASQLFDVAYTNNVGVGDATVTVTGKGEYAGQKTRRAFTITATKLEDDNISTTDASVRRLMVDGRFVYIFTNAAAAQATVARRSLIVKDVLLAGGGGAGGNSFGGGGGGGGVIALDGVNAFFMGGGTIPFAVGAGGASGTSRNRGGNGGDTTFVVEGTTYVAKGGGGGGGYDQKAGSAGGSGGGGCCGGAGGAGTEGQGCAGANAGYASRAGGGGGAAHAGYVYSDDPKKAGNGGEGVANAITGETVYYGGGGGGGGSNYGWDEYDRGFGGIGGGADGVRGGHGKPGADGLGGGGGGSGWWNNTYYIGGKGGSGTVILAVESVGLDLLPIPDQSHDSGAPCRPEMVVSNTQNSVTWTIGGDIASPLFDVEYENNDGIGVAKVTVVGKGDYAGKMLMGYFNIVATKFDDENISVADPTVRRRDIDGSHVYIFTNAASAKTVTVKRGISLAGFLLVGGGGGGGHTMAGGGGGGGVTNATGLVGVHACKNDTFTLVVGAGGEGSTGQSVKGGNGRETAFDFGLLTVSAFGGGGGGSWTSQGGAKGASGGGGCQSSSGGAGIAGLGFAGANGAGSNSSASGGGGGAGHAGYAANTTTKIAGNGGEGVSNNVTGAWVVYGGGGGGGGSSNGYGLYSAGLGGPGGGGDGGRSTAGANGVDGLGGGGGGGGYNGNGCSGGNGGSGIAVLVIKPADFEIDPIPAQKLVSGGCEPIPVVHSADGETLLVKDVDYTVSYANNAQTGIAQMTITGIGDYAGKTATVSFKVYGLYYADPGVTSGGDGLSWSTAMSVSNALVAAAEQSGLSEVWIKEGTLFAPAIAITNYANLTIRGGFAGTETSLDERAEGVLTVFDGESTSSILLTIDNATDDDIVLDRVKFRRARSNGLVKTGKGGLRAYDCAFETNGRNVSEVYGRGMNAQSDGYGSLVVSNCVFAGNRSVNSDKQWGGFGLYVKSFKNALIDNSLFVTNGYDLTKTPGSTYVGYLNARGSALLVDSTPVTIRNSRFAGNCCPVRKKDDTYWCGGTIALNGACGGSVIDHCALIGNTELLSAGDEGSNSGGAIAVRMNSTSAKVAIRNCTIAYNITQSPGSSGGITVYRGAADISNTILWKNLRYHTSTAGYGKDVHVASGSARISHSLVTSLDSSDECVVGANLVVDADTVFAADPRLVTSTAEFESLLVQNTSAPYYRPTTSNTTVYEDLATMDAHLKSPTGYFVNGGAEGPATSDYSPAIDMGDPDADYANEPSPNGARLNLGAYGNTAEASSTATGQPSAEIEVLFPDGAARPLARITMGLESGAGYLANVQVVCLAGGVVLKTATYRQVANGDVIEILSPVYLPQGVEFEVAVTVTAHNAETVDCSKSTTVEGTYPPYYGKGGGSSVVHVRTGADCKMDGTSWTDAYPDLATALASAPDASKTEMWLAVSNDHMVAAVTLAGSLTVRGGFTGVENAPEERPEGAHTWLDGFNCNFPPLEFVVPADALLTVERIRFAHAKASGIRKTGAGDLLVRDCSFTGRKQSEYNLQGGGIYASGGTASVTNCQFVNLIDYSVNALSSSSYGGDGIFLSGCTQAYVDDCLFATNGIQFNRNKGAQARHTGSAVYVSATPAVFRNCRFASNGAAIMDGTASGGTVYFTGNCDGSKLINCVFVGNAEFEGSQSAAEPVSGGAIACNMSAATQTLDIENCTVAYNLTLGYKTGAGINVYKGTVNLKNSIVYGNIRGRQTDIAGADIQVHAAGALNMSYTLVTGPGTAYVNVAEGGTLNIGDGVIYDDPLLATTTNDVANLLVADGATFYLPQSARAACAAIDVHPRTRTGYMLDGVRIRDPENVESPTIDAGDPKSDYSREPEISGVGGNGHRVNLGAYGNTPEAALTKPKGFFLLLR